MVTRLLALFALSVFAVSCATWTPSQKQAATVAGWALAGFAAGVATVPKGESSTMHGLLWGGLAGTSAGVILPLIKSGESSARREPSEMETKAASQEALINQGLGFERSVPRDYQGLIKPGAWRIYKIDNWVEAGEGRIIHQDKMVEVIPPQLNAVTK